MRTLIVEDEPLARRKLRGLLEEVPWVEIAGEAEDGERAVALIDALEPDLVLLDIQMPEMSGLDVLRRVHHSPAVIFTTAYDRYAVNAFELEAVDYLLKPFGRERLFAALERARKSIADDDAPSVVERARAALGNSGPLTRILIRDRGRLTPIAVRDIERLEAEDDYVALFASGRRFLVYLPLQEFEQRLPAEGFVRIHRAHIVNLDFVTHFAPYDGGRLQVEMKDGTKLMVSRVRSKELRHLAL